MKHSFTVLFFFCVLIGFSNSNAQVPVGRLKKITREIREEPWSAIVGVNILDDDGNAFGGLLQAPKSWNMMPYPNKISIEKYLKFGWSVEIPFSYNAYKKNRVINGEGTSISHILFSTDLNVKYDLNKLVGSTKWLDPYINHGYGFTYKTGELNQKSFSLNLGLGFNVWPRKDMAISFQSIGKLGLKSNFFTTSSNYFQHSIGFVYKFGGYSFLRSKRYL